MRILITNDDGITAPGLAVAEAIAADLAGPDGELWVVAPEGERSGVSHAISYTVPLRYSEIAPRRYIVDGFPADCVLLGLRRILADHPPDLVISGVNRGHNVAEDVVYSGTVGAAMEGAMTGARSIALSQFYSRAETAPEDMWEVARTMGAETVRRVLEMPLSPGAFYNVNFPAVRAEAVAGTCVAPQGIRGEGTFDVVPFTAPNGREFQFFRHMTRNDSAAEGSDARMLVDGWITVTPLAVQLTAEHLMEGARAALG